MAVSVLVRKAYERYRRSGMGLETAAKKAGITPRTAYRWEQEKREGLKILPIVKKHIVREVVGDEPEPLAYEDLCAEAKRAWDDFGYFQRRYFGRIATPWQEEAANQVVEWLATPHKEYVVVNAPPGAGKSTLFTHDIPAWITVRNRSIRGLIGSKIQSSAERYLQRLRRGLESPIPLHSEDEDIAYGLALEPTGCLSEDYGIFRPNSKDVWNNQSFIVAQHGNVLITEKEPTWSAFGMDSGFLGMRYDLVIWDDVVDDLVLRTVESRENQHRWWDRVAERRLDPHGVLILQGQRMGPDDLYRYCLDKRKSVRDETPKYKHVVFKAHYDDRCTEQHELEDPYYPEGCLLDPRRVTWEEIESIQADKTNNFEILYQQEDTDPATVLVNPLWITGGQDPKTHEMFPGCLDKERGICELSKALFGQLLSICTCDPSSAKYWSIQWWIVRVVDGKAHERYLMDHIRKAMDAPALLDWNHATGQFSGIMYEWQLRSRDHGWPVQTWIVEANAAQRYLLQYEHVRRFMSEFRVSIIPHQTQRNKSDPELGIQILKNLYRYGLVRLPHTSGPAYFASAKLIEEVTHWPEWKTEDCVMAQWFLEWNLPNLLPGTKALKRFDRPSWLREANTWNWKEKAYG